MSDEGTHRDVKTKASSNSSLDEENLAVLPPVYVDQQEDLDLKLKRAQDLFKDLKKMQASRVRISFDRDERAE